MSYRLATSSLGLRRVLSGRGRRPLIIHMHVMKSAGQTVSAYLKRCFGSYNKTNRGHLLCENRLGERATEADIAAACAADYVTGHLSWETLCAIRERRDTYVFTVLRNPDERVRSLYNFMSATLAEKSPAHLRDLYARVRAMSPFEFLATEDPEIRHLVDDVMVRQFSGSFDQGPADADMARRARDNLKTIDFIAHVETLEDDLTAIMLANNLPRPRQLRSVNVTRRKRVSAAWDDSCQELLDRRIMCDRDLYGRLQSG